LVHSDQLEQEVRQTANIEDNDDYHAWSILTTSPESSHRQDEDGDRYGGNGAVKFGIGNRCDDGQELDREAEEEEKVEFQKGDINLCSS
jgi:hypothetical protein